MARQSALIRVIAFITGVGLIIAGGFDFLVTTIPGVALIIWSLTGNFRPLSSL